MKFEIGTKVRVKIADRLRYTRDCADIVDGKTGKIVLENLNSTNGYPCPGLAFVVEFDERVNAWGTMNHPVREFWFAPCDLEILEKPAECFVG